MSQYLPTTLLTAAAQDMTQSQIEALPAFGTASEVVSDRARTLKHRRNYCYEVYERADGLWDIEAQMQDRKTYDFTLADALHSAGEPLHSMVMRITVDDTLTIVAVAACTLAAPYLAQCATITPDYQKMVGLNLMQGFRHAMRERFGGEHGCTHITELCNSLPTVAIQGVGVELAARRRNAVGEAQAERPFQLNQCHALQESAEAVRLYYPRWYRANFPK